MLGMSARGRGLQAPTGRGGGAPVLPSPPVQASLRSIMNLVVQKLKGVNTPQALSLEEQMAKISLQDEQYENQHATILEKIRVKVTQNPNARIDMEKQNLKILAGKRAELRKRIQVLANLSNALEIRRDSADFMRTIGAGIQELKREEALAKQDTGLDIDEIAGDYDDLIAEAVNAGRESTSAFTESRAVENLYGGMTEGEEGEEGQITIADQIDADIDSIRRKALEQESARSDEEGLDLRAVLPSISRTSPAPVPSTPLPTAQTRPQKGPSWMINGNNW